jgi:hypothetical protein
MPILGLNCFQCLQQLLFLVDKFFLFVLTILQHAFPVFVQLVIGFLYMIRLFVQQTDQNSAFVPRLHYITLYYIILHYITLYYIILHYITHTNDVCQVSVTSWHTRSKEQS